MKEQKLNHPTFFTTFSFENLPKRIQNRLNYLFIWPLKTMVVSRRAYKHARAHKDFVPVTILFYPEAPKTYHTMYKICAFLGWKVITNPKKHADIRIFFEDITYRKKYPALEELRKKHRILNIDCTDISKKHVEKVFYDVFGYGTALDPLTHNGVCVKKSNINAVHDGKIIDCPIQEVEEGCVYQKYINTLNEEERASELRIHLFNGKSSVVLKRYKNKDDLFHITTEAEFVEPDEVLSKDEQEKIALFCKKMGLDYGEVDALRDRDNGKLYIVDVNSTPAGPIGPMYDNSSHLRRWFLDVATAAKEELLK